MNRYTLCGLATACLAMLVGCSQTSDVGDDGTGATGAACKADQECPSGGKCNSLGGASGKCMQASERPASLGAFLCSSSSPCPDGQFCFNGLCAYGCQTDANCASNQYCDTDFSMLCKNKTVAGCSGDSECAETQTCIMGLCSGAQLPAECTPRVDGQDGCDKYSLCIDRDTSSEASKNECVSFPPCPKDGKCPPGQAGSVCNEKDIPGKERICLTGMCKSVSDCPNAFKCVMGGGTLGLCSNGTIGNPCKDKNDCQSGLDCMGGGMAGLIGLCMSGFGVPGTGGFGGF